MNKEKISEDAAKITTALRMRQYKADETILLLKTLQHLLGVQAIQKDLAVVSVQKLKELVGDPTRIQTLIDDSRR